MMGNSNVYIFYVATAIGFVVVPALIYSIAWLLARPWPGPGPYKSRNWGDCRFDENTYSAGDGESIDPEWWKRDREDDE